MEQKEKKKLLEETMDGISPFWRQTQMQEIQKTPSWINTKKTTSRHFIVKLLKTNDKETILKVDKEKWHNRHRATKTWVTLTSHQKQWQPSTVE